MKAVHFGYVVSQLIIGHWSCWGEGWVYPSSSHPLCFVSLNGFREENHPSRQLLLLTVRLLCLNKETIQTHQAGNHQQWSKQNQYMA